MTVAELIDWLKTKDQDAIVEVVYEGDKVKFNPYLRETSFCGDHWYYTDFRGNQFVKDGNVYFNKRYLLLGEEG